MPNLFEATGPLDGTLRAPADKSISHRAALFGAMGEGATTVEGFLDSADTRSSLAAVQALGATVTGVTPEAISGEITITGVGLRGARSASIDVGNAGTLMRLLPGWLAGQPDGEWTLDGDESIRRRPVDRVADPLRLMGADVEDADGLPPLRVRGARLSGTTYEMPVASAQVKSCVLIAGLLAEGETRVVEPEPSRDHTELMLAAAGADVSHQGLTVVIEPADRIAPGHIVVPGDISSAAFFLVAAAVVPGSDVTVEGVGINPTRTGIVSVLERMGASIEVAPKDGGGGEPIGSIRVRAGGLSAAEIGGAEVPTLIDELPIIALAACFAHGDTVIRDAAELRRKETDRIKTVAAALRAIGASVDTTEDGMVIHGGGGVAGGTVDAEGDHRIAMLGAVAGVASENGVRVEGMDAAAVSYPGFGDDLLSLRT